MLIFRLPMYQGMTMINITMYGSYENDSDSYWNAQNYLVSMLALFCYIV